MVKVKGYVEHIIFRNEENGYTVLEMSSEGEKFTAVGIFPYVDAGAFLELSGEYTGHPIYGRQFKVTGFEEAAPADTVSIERYLGSGAIKGVGAALAARIVLRFGERTLDIIENEPERLAEVKGISERKAREIAAQAAEKRELRDAMMFLQKFGISVNLSVKIYKRYGEDIYKVIRENPYRLAEDIQGVGFRTADEIARRAGIREDDPGRLQSGILYTLLTASGQGHTCLPEEELVLRAAQTLGCGIDDVEEQVSVLCIERKVIRKRLHDDEGGERIFTYAAAAYYAELEVAVMLIRMNVAMEDRYEGSTAGELYLENDDGFKLDDVQLGAVDAAVRNGVMILTGGPGTGKTTTINAIIRRFEAEGLEVRLAAPTGRAAKRMTEATGFEASTIHRMLEISAVSEELEERADFGRNEDNPLEADVVIIDEMSMVDIYLMRALLKALLPGTRLILVGDENQLPSVGPGSVLKDLTASGVFETVRLTRIFRQAAMSDIVTNAHRINRGESLKLDNRSKDFFFLKREDPKLVLRVVLSLVQEKLPGYVGVTSFDIQVLTPMRKGVLGVENLNLMLQYYLNPASPEKQEIPFGHIPAGENEEGRRVLRTGDKVMQIKNNYRLEWEVRNRYGIAVDRGTGIFNGDMGVVRAINSFAEELTVEFDEGRMVDYPFAMLDELELAYAITVHKAQGSEYPAVVLPLLGGPKPLLCRNLLYTAVTRARSCVAIVGSDRTVEEMIENETEQKRYTGLREALQSYISPQMSGL